MLRDNKGIVFLKAIILILALIGAWFVYTSYRQDRLKDNMSVVLEDYKSLVMSVLNNPGDRAKVENLFAEMAGGNDPEGSLNQIQAILNQYGGTENIQEELERLKSRFH